MKEGDLPWNFGTPEKHSPNVRFSIKIDRQLYSGQSDFQRIDILQSQEFGRILTLDGLIMVTEKDEFIYHEMIVHPAMAVNPQTRKVLVIGAGDGGTVRELARYPQIQQIDLVEIDEMVVQVCREYLPQTACKLDDPRLRIFYEDGLKFIRFQEDMYDLIIVDSTDPFGPGEGLFSKEFYGNCFKALTENGILINQHESPFYEVDADNMRRAHQRLVATFPICKVYQFHMPTYPSGPGLWICLEKFHPVRSLDAASWNQLGIPTRYYNTDIHRGAFYLPTYVKEVLTSVE